MKILVIDDDMRYQDLVLPHLECYGYEVEFANTAAAGISKAARTNFALLMVDGTLPDDNGVNVIQQIRDSGNQVPIIFVSAMWRDQKTSDRLLNQLGVALVKPKPIVPKELCKNIVDLIGIPKSAAVEEVDAVEKEAKAAAISALTPEEKLEAVRQMYLNDLPQMLREIREKVDSAWRFPGTQVDLSGLVIQVHNLKGTAGMYGHLELGQLMARIEAYLKAVETGTEYLTEDSWQSVEEALRQAERELV